MQGIVNMSIGSVLDMPIANRDINVNGRPFKAGQPIPKEYVAVMNGEPNKYRNVINFKKMVTALVDGADQVIFDLNEVENIISTNQRWGPKGSVKYKDNQTKLNTKGRYKSEYPALFGGTSQQAPQTKTKTESYLDTGSVKKIPNSQALAFDIGTDQYRYDAVTGNLFKNGTVVKEVFVPQSGTVKLEGNYYLDANGKIGKLATKTVTTGGNKTIPTVGGYKPKKR
jgi:hypothetical protein